MFALLPHLSHTEAATALNHLCVCVCVWKSLRTFTVRFWLSRYPFFDLTSCIHSLKYCRRSSVGFNKNDIDRILAAPWHRRVQTGVFIRMPDASSSSSLSSLSPSSSSSSSSSARPWSRLKQVCVYRLSPGREERHRAHRKTHDAAVCLMWDTIILSTQR